MTPWHDEMNLFQEDWNIKNKKISYSYKNCLPSRGKCSTLLNIRSKVAESRNCNLTYSYYNINKYMAACRRKIKPCVSRLGKKNINGSKELFHSFVQQIFISYSSYNLVVEFTLRQRGLIVSFEILLIIDWRKRLSAHLLRTIVQTGVRRPAQVRTFKLSLLCLHVNIVLNKTRLSSYFSPSAYCERINQLFHSY